MSHGHSAKSHSPKKKKKKGTKFPWIGLVAWWFVCSTFAFSPILGALSLITLGFVPSMVEVLMYPFEKISELGDKKEGEKKKNAHSSHH